MTDYPPQVEYMTDYPPQVEYMTDYPPQVVEDTLQQYSTRGTATINFAEFLEMLRPHI